MWRRIRRIRKSVGRKIKKKRKWRRYSVEAGKVGGRLRRLNNKRNSVEEGQEEEQCGGKVEQDNASEKSRKQESGGGAVWKFKSRRMSVEED